MKINLIQVRLGIMSSPMIVWKKTLLETTKRMIQGMERAKAMEARLEVREQVAIPV